MRILCEEPHAASSSPPLGFPGGDYEILDVRDRRFSVFFPAYVRRKPPFVSSVADFQIGIFRPEHRHCIPPVRRSAYGYMVTEMGTSTYVLKARTVRAHSTRVRTYVRTYGTCTQH